MNGLPESFAVATLGLSMHFGKQTALDGVDLRVPEGAVFVLIGANGAWKSTAMKVLLNLERPDAGNAETLRADQFAAECRGDVAERDLCRVDHRAATRLTSRRSAP